MTSSNPKQLNPITEPKMPFLKFKNHKNKIKSTHRLIPFLWWYKHIPDMRNSHIWF